MTKMDAAPALPENVDALLLDAGNTIVFLDFEALALVCADAGEPVTASALGASEIAAKKRYEAIVASGEVSHDDAWYRYMETLLVTAGADAVRARRILPAVRHAHDALNLWRRVPGGLDAALGRARDAGLRLGVISNSEGGIEELLRHVGLRHHFEVVLDSHVEGVAKPDPEIFRRALERMSVRPERALYVGDVPRVDVDGARAAGLEGALVDAAGNFADRRDVARFPSVEAVIDALLGRRKSSRTSSNS